jgi:hypothetical protein
VSQLLRAGNKVWKQLPWMRNFMTEGGDNLLCYNYLCGTCRHGGRCNFAHVPGKELETEFAKDMLNVLKPGMDWLSTQEPYNRQQSGGGYGGGGRGQTYGGGRRGGYNGGRGGGRYNNNSPNKRGRRA